MLTKKIIIPVVFLAIAGVALIGGTQAFAEENGKTTTLAQKLATRFNLNQDEVGQFFEEVHREKSEEMKVRFEERLSQAVAKGEITEAQKKLIMDKHSEMRTSMENGREELKAWLEENGISEEYFMMRGPGRFKHM